MYSLRSSNNLLWQIMQNIFYTFLQMINYSANPPANAPFDVFSHEHLKRSVELFTCCLECQIRLLFSALFLLSYSLSSFILNRWSCVCLQSLALLSFFFCSYPASFLLLSTSVLGVSGSSISAVPGRERKSKLTNRWEPPYILLHFKLLKSNALGWQHLPLSASLAFFM